MDNQTQFPPTPRQKVLLDFLRSYMREHECAPSFSEMASGIGAKSKSNIYVLLDGLEERGFIERLPRRSRAIALKQNILGVE